MTAQNFIGLSKIRKAFGILFILATVSCSESEYRQLVKKEMASGAIHDSLMFDMHFGQTKKQFFDQCWKLNKKGWVRQGPNNQFVEYKLPLRQDQSLKDAITLLFYGIFDESDLMTGMDLRFSYDGWSLWNEKLQSKELVHAVKDSLKKWYPGNDFKLLNMPGDTTPVYVKIDGNRRILIQPLDDSRTVKAKIEDLRFLLDK
ncbi:hypothetical protein [Pseudozobellia thermophila]|uniref:Uncharacterized protein n=1 Tax=Pseudozobellia thermophila TaxID=192903 RepID=A0A1M6CXQ1_9FLAO|nr:hypothetical protein [Pseudozobellia thermophila]SHI65730.1 hypothetical protein SAMN04488513_101914 [Pseudozobellia thermophila]